MFVGLHIYSWSVLIPRYGDPSSRASYSSTTQEEKEEEEEEEEEEKEDKKEDGDGHKRKINSCPAIGAYMRQTLS